MTTLEAALAYAARGWLVFACKPGLKVPATPHGVKDATTEPETIQAWWTRWPDANIALACGPASGVYVVDVDLDKEKGIDGWKSLEDLPTLPQTVMQCSPRGGAHFLFQSGIPPKNKNNFRAGIDIRSDGYYIMLAPSIHPNGKVYEWAPGLGPDDVPMAEFPNAFRPVERAVPPWERQNASKPVEKPTLRPTEGTPTLERASLYLRECDPAIQGMGGHDALLWAARAMVIGFELSDSDALSLLWNDFNPRCNPPWDRAKPGDVKDFERKVSEAKRTPGQKPSGWLLDECGLRGNETALLDYGAKLRDGLLASVEKESKAKLAIPSILVPSEVGRLSKSGGGVWDNWLLNPTGYVGDLARWMVVSSGTPQPKLSVLAAMIAAGALFGGKVRDISDGRTNLYGMGVAESSAGKDHPFKCILKLFAAAGAEKLLGGGRVTSDSAIEVALMDNYAQLFGFDESGDFLSHIKQAGCGSGNSSHLSTIKPALKELWSSANCLYRGKQRAEGELRRILEPHVCLWCLSTPGRLYQGITADDLADGFLARIIFAISFDWPDYSFTTSAPPPDSLVSITQAWLMRQISAPEGMKDVAAATTRHQLLVPMQPDAVTIFNRFNKQCAKLLREGTQKGDKIAPLWGKAFENARRIALTLASGDRYDGAEIMEYHAKYSCTFIEQTILDTIDSISQNMAENRFEADKQRLVKIIARAGRDGMSKGIFSTKTGFLDKRQRDSYIAELVECNEIVFGRNPDHPEARSGWLWKYPHGLDVIERSLPGTGSPRPAGVGAGPKGPKSTPGGSK